MNIIFFNYIFTKREAAKYVLVTGEVEAERAIKEVHEEACGSHIVERALASKIVRVGFYWSTLKRDSLTFIKKCDNCQHYADRHQAPPEQLHSVASPRPFYMWWVDILGLFLLALGQVKFLMVAVDYFIKWIEVEPVATISTKRVKRFYWKKIICRFGLPVVIQSSTSVEQPQSTGKPKSRTKLYLKDCVSGSKRAKGCWVEELPQSDNYEEELRENLYMLQEEREMTYIRKCAAKDKVARIYNSTVFPRPIRKDDLVLGRTLIGAATNKLTSNWEGLFRVQEEVRHGAFRLEHLDGKVVPRTWNSATLRKYYN
ncbi:Gypsy retrotransposon integrase-like protein 1, partial [Mucuna pruriens]